MSFKNFLRDIQELKGGIGSISRRSFEIKLSHLRSRSHSVVVATDTQLKEEALDQSYWVNIPTELLRDVISRIEASENFWPSRRDVVSCAAVCSSWREITKELVKTVELSGKITFPISLKQPGPRDAIMQCYIKRDRTTSSYYLYLGLSPSECLFHAS
ncbi:hypothetical protein O6H91_Y000700 [Diphasiastrum complanatum]|nr:hypothetical protein O6H91_Y000700 [Diphasiastrum complanatum]